MSRLHSAFIRGTGLAKFQVALHSRTTCYELTKAVPVVQVLRLWGEPAIMLDMLEERAS